MFDQDCGRVLLVSSSPALQSCRRSSLERQGYQVTCSADPREAQSLAMAVRFSVVVIGPEYEVRSIREIVRWIRHTGSRVLLVHEGERPRVCADAFLPQTHGIEQFLRVVGWLAWR